MTENQQHSFIKQHIPFAKYLTKRVVGDDWSERFKDAFSAALIALVESASRYDPNRGTTFPRYAWKRIEGAIKNELNTIDIDSTGYLADCPSVEQNIEGIINKKETIKILDECIQSALKPNEQKVLTLYYYHGKKLKEIANIIKINENTVKSWLYRSKEKLLKCLKKRINLDGEIYYGQ